jgi:hypothetical protein
MRIERRDSVNDHPRLVDAVFPARGFSLLAWYAKNFGISDLDVAEAEWVAHWVKSNHNRLRYNPNLCVWRWVA